jgi:hypothetical protein
VPVVTAETPKSSRHQKSVSRFPIAVWQHVLHAIRWKVQKRGRGRRRSNSSEYGMKLFEYGRVRQIDNMRHHGVVTA